MSILARLVASAAGKEEHVGSVAPVPRLQRAQHTVEGERRRKPALDGSA